MAITAHDDHVGSDVEHLRLNLFLDAVAGASQRVAFRRHPMARQGGGNIVAGCELPHRVVQEALHRHDPNGLGLRQQRHRVKDGAGGLPTTVPSNQNGLAEGAGGPVGRHAEDRASGGEDKLLNLVAREGGFPPAHLGKGSSRRRAPRNRHGATQGSRAPCPPAIQRRPPPIRSPA